MTTDKASTADQEGGALDAELAAMAKVLSALKDLEPPLQQSVIEWAARRFGLTIPIGSRGDATPNAERVLTSSRAEQSPARVEDRVPKTDPNEVAGEIEGINVVAQKWIRRSGLTEEQLTRLFSLGVDDIDVVAKSVPGKKKIERLKNVLLLQGVAAYLSSGVARVEWAKLKEAAGHYDADAGGNFPSYLKSFSAEATGSVSTGFTLTSRGLNEAKELIAAMTTPTAKT